MMDRGKPNVITWTCIIDSLGMHGFGALAMQRFREMQEARIEPNATTLVCVLNACSHSGMHETAWNIYSTMHEQYGISPNESHNACMVDVWARAGLFERAEQFIHSLENPSTLLWKTLLGAAHHQGKHELAQRAAALVFEQEPSDAATYVVLGNILSGAGATSASAQLWQEMRVKNMKKTPGVTWVTINGKPETFYVDDRDHPYHSFTLLTVVLSMLFSCPI